MKDLTQIGFKVSITIECETEEEILSHLIAIQQEVKRHTRDGIRDGLDLQWDDENCYGRHEVKIEPDLQ